MNPAPAGVHAGPRSKASLGTIVARSARRHAHVSSGGGACEALATCPMVTYPSGGTGFQKEIVPAFFPCARQPESRHTISQSTGHATGGLRFDETRRRRSSTRRIWTTTVDAGGCSSATATSPSETNPSGHDGRQTDSRECAPLLKSHHTRVNSTTVAVGGASSPKTPATPRTLPDERPSDAPEVRPFLSAPSMFVSFGTEGPDEAPDGPETSSPGSPVGDRRSKHAANPFRGACGAWCADDDAPVSELPFTSVRALLSTIHTGGSPTPAHALPKTPSAAHVSSTLTHLTQSAGGGVWCSVSVRVRSLSLS